MNWKRYPIRAVKYVFYFYAFFILLYLVMHLISGKSTSAVPDFATLFTPRLLIGLVVLGVCYPLVGFNTVRIAMTEGGWEVHGKALHEAMADCKYKFLRNEEGRLVFCANTPMRRLFTMFEDEITLELQSDNTLVVSGLRKDVALVRLKVGDYIRRTV